MTEKIDEILKKIAADTSKTNSLNSSKNNSDHNLSSQSGKTGLPGSPDCPICGGIGYLRVDVPVGHPSFGRIEICSCRNSQVSQQVRQRLYALSHLEELRNLTFENFQPRGRVGMWPKEADSLELAYNQARQFAHNLNGWLLLLGEYGCGKTHLAAAIGNFAVEMGVPTLFITVPDLLDSLRASYQDHDTGFEARFEEVRQAPLLVLDDFGTQNATPWAQEKLFQIINYRYINHLPLVVTSNLQLREFEGRIRSRLEDPELVSIVRILAPDYRRPAGDTGHPEMSSLDLMHGQTFATFDLRRGENLPAADLKTLEIAFQAAREFAEKPTGWIVFTGPYGCGKTHLAAAIGNYRSDLGAPPRFMVVPDLLDHLRATFNPNSSVRYDRRFEDVKTASLLILDDLGTQAMTPWVREKLYQIFNYRYTAELPTVITTADRLDEMDERIRSRMFDRRLCRIIPLSAPAFTGSPAREQKPASRRTNTKRRTLDY